MDGMTVLLEIWPDAATQARAAKTPMSYVSVGTGGQYASGDRWWASLQDQGTIDQQRAVADAFTGALGGDVLTVQGH